MLAVDIGNTFARIVAFSGEAVRARRSFHVRDLDLDELSGAFGEMAGPADAGPVWIASVNPRVNALVDAAADRRGLARRFIRPESDFIMPHRLRTPETTGADRLLAALAAGRRHFPGAGGYVVVQCGTAATVDLVDADGVFRGGYILPGPTMWLLGVSVAAQLPDLSSELPDFTEVRVGDNTKDAILRGMQAALPLAVAGAALAIDAGDGAAAPDGRGLPVVVTGGWGEAVLPYLRAPRRYDRDLLLHGIRLHAEAHG